MDTKIIVMKVHLTPDNQHGRCVTTSNQVSILSLMVLTRMDSAVFFS